MGQFINRNHLQAFDVVDARILFSDGRDAKPRPAIVIPFNGPDGKRRLGHMPITSQYTNIPVQKQARVKLFDRKSAGIDRPEHPNSYVKCGHFKSEPFDDLPEKIEREGRLSDADIKQVVKCDANVMNRYRQARRHDPDLHDHMYHALSRFNKRDHSGEFDVEAMNKDEQQFKQRKNHHSHHDFEL